MATTSGEVYVHDGNGKFAYFDVGTNSVTRTGKLDRQLTDVAFGPDGQFFGIDFFSLYRVDPQTGRTTYLRRLPVGDANGLDMRDSDTAVVTTIGGRWLEINTETGATEFSTQLPNNAGSAGDVTAYVSDTSRRTWIVSGAGGIFARWNYDSLGVGTGSTQRHALPDFWGLASVGGSKDLIGGAGYQLYAVDADSGIGHAIADLRSFGFSQIWGASWVVKPPIPATFEPLQYIASYPDLISAFGADATAGLNHYVAAGRDEGRTITFHGLDYIASYGDLITAFSANAAAGAAHYIAAGRNEGRTVTFDGLDYIASYGDLIAAFSADEAAGANHYILAGRNEGRTVSFNPAQYLANYPDLRKAFGNDQDLATQHYISNGFSEGRTDNTPLPKAFNLKDVGGIYAEMALLSERAYDRRFSASTASGEMLDPETRKALAGVKDVIGSRWTPLTASALHAPSLRDDGGTDHPILYDYGMYVNSDAAAFVGEAMVDGKRTAVVAFRGTDNKLADILTGEYIFPVHYARFNPLLNALKDYIARNHVKQVFVTGHSLGGAMTEMFMYENRPDAADGTTRGVRYVAATFGSPGSPARNPGYLDSRIVQFQDTVDEVAKGGLLAYRKSGRTVDIDSPLNFVAPFSAHDMIRYAGEVRRMAQAELPFMPSDASIPNSAVDSEHVVIGYAAKQNSLDGDTLGFDSREYLIGGSANDRLSGGSDVDYMVAGPGDDSLDGKNGADTLVGGLGHDSLTGGTDGDKFYYGSPADGGGGTGDTIWDFGRSADDKIVIYSPNFGPLAGRSGTLPLENFVAGSSTTLPTDRMLKPNAFFSYSTTTRRLFFDSDGAGNAATPVTLATINFLKAGDSLSNTDIFLTTTPLG